MHSLKMNLNLTDANDMNIQIKLLKHVLTTFSLVETL